MLIMNILISPLEIRYKMPKLLIRLTQGSIIMILEVIRYTVLQPGLTLERPGKLLKHNDASALSPNILI